MLAPYCRIRYKMGMERDIIALQELISHQGEDIARLSAELYAQQRELAALRAQMALVHAQMRTQSQHAPDGAETLTEPPPPHY